MGSADNDKDAADDEKPQHIVEIPYDYWLARFPVTNEQYSEYVREVGKDRRIGNWQAKKNHPMTRAGWEDAMAYCKWLDELSKGKLPYHYVLRLPSEAEWEKAARGPYPMSTTGSRGGNIYPWGNEFDKNKCNTHEGDRHDTTPVGLYSPQGDSPYGCGDMSGNAWEWTHSLLEHYPYDARDGREIEDTTSGARVLRGGSCVGDARYARCACRFGNPINYFVGDTGFRLVIAPKLS